MNVNLVGRVPNKTNIIQCNTNSNDDSISKIDADQPKKTKISIKNLLHQDYPARPGLSLFLRDQNFIVDNIYKAQC